MKHCSNTECGKEVPSYLNYCSSECHIHAARMDGAIEHLPNGLPIACITRTHLLEVSGGDHPDYICPVEAEYVGVREEGLADWEYGNQTHALIYIDGSIAVTLYEMCYAMWYVNDGEFGGGALWKKGEWKLTEASSKTIEERYEKKIKQK